MKVPLSVSFRRDLSYSRRTKEPLVAAVKVRSYSSHLSALKRTVRRAVAAPVFS